MTTQRRLVKIVGPMALVGILYVMGGTLMAVDAPNPAPLVSAGEFTRIYDPSVGEDRPWYINDHCFIRGANGMWHIFGITHAEPADPIDEDNFAHAIANSLTQKPWKKKPFALSVDWDTWKEVHLWAPHVVFNKGVYYMFYCAGGPENAQYRIHLATSTDLWSWKRHPRNPMVVDGFDARDPMVLKVGNKWVMYYTCTSEPAGGYHIVAYRTSKDLVKWGAKNTAFTFPQQGTFGGPTESPFVVRRGKYYYLFCGPQGDYRGTAVYRSKDPFHWEKKDEVGHIDSHAAEVIRDSDGKWYISHCGWGQGGVYLAPLFWNDGLDDSDTSLPPPGKPKESTMKPTHHRAQWMADGSYGLMVHYFPAPSGDTPEAKTADFNRTIDAFDLDTFIKQFEESGADWMIFTIAQNTGYYNSSNSVMDRLIPGRTSKRDLIMEIARRVKKLNKRFIAYIGAPLVSPMEPGIQKAFGWDDNDPSGYVKSYHEFLRAYSRKFGKLCDGWWFDGCYDWISKGKLNWADWIAPARAGNPNSIVALNDGSFCIAREKPISPLQDYLSGEVHLLHKGQIVFGYPPEGGFNISPEGRLLYDENPSKLYMPASQYVDGVQWHALVPIDSSFNAPTIPYSACHYSDEELIQFVKGCKAVRGAVTLNAPTDITGHIPAETAAQLKRLGKALE